MATFAFATIFLAAVAAGTEPTAPNDGSISLHELAVKQFASTLAIADVASDRCVDILVNMKMLDEFRDRLGMTVTDRPALKTEVAQAREILHEAIADAPSPQAWCDAAYRMYGPEGSLIRGFMLRSGKKRNE